MRSQATHRVVTLRGAPPPPGAGSPDFEADGAVSRPENMAFVQTPLPVEPLVALFQNSSVSLLV